MSYWTHITACLSVETNIAAKKPQLMKQVKEYLQDAPKITGSEGNADIFVNIPSGYNWYVSIDCEHCKYNDTIQEYTDKEGGYFECDRPEDYDCSAKYQTCVVISIQGDLRDRTRQHTKKEFNEFKKYLSRVWYIRNYTVKIEGE